MDHDHEIEDTMTTENLPVIARFAVRRRAYLAPDGSIRRELPSFADDRDLIAALYRGMVQARAFDLKAVALQRTGRLGTYATSLGQEAVGRRRQRHAAGPRTAAELPRQRRAAVARGDNARHPFVLGRRRARQRL